MNEKLRYGFTMNGKRWIFEIREFSVRDFLKMFYEARIFDSEVEIEARELAVQKSVATFLKKHLPEGESMAELEKSLEDMPQECYECIADALIDPILPVEAFRRNAPTGQKNEKKQSIPSFFRLFAFLLRASKGGLTHFEIMNLTYSQLFHYLDAFGYVLNQETEEGRKENRVNDEMERCSGEVDVERVMEIRRKNEELVRRHLR